MTLRLGDVVLVSPPPVPVTVRVDVPIGVGEPQFVVVIVSVDEVPVVEVGLNEPVAPAGRPPMLSATDDGQAVRVMVIA
jgi:hypothetical protein